MPAITRTVTKAKEIIYSTGDVRGVLSEPSAQRMLLVVAPANTPPKHLDQLLAKAKARDGVAGMTLLENHKFVQRPDGVVELHKEEVVA